MLQKLSTIRQLIYCTLCCFLIPAWTSNLTMKTHTFQLTFFLWSFLLLKCNAFYAISTSFSLGLPIPSTEEFQLFKPHPIPIYLDFNTDVISPVYMKPQISYLAISLNNQSYFTTDENFLNACYRNGFQTFCHPPISIFNTNNNPISETSMFLISQRYKCKIFIAFSKYPFLTP